MQAPANLADVIGEHARHRPGAVAVVEGGRSWNYAEFDRAIWRAATSFRAQGIAPGDKVGVRMPDTATHFVVSYALARMGAIQITLPARESPAARQALEERHRVATTIGAGDVKSSWLEPGGGAWDESVRAAGGDLPWKAVTTSGTTSAPKTVFQTHAMHIAWRRINQAAVPVQPQDRYLVSVPLDFFAGFRLCMDVHWAGAAVIVGEQAASHLDFIAAVERTAANYLYLTPLHLHQLLPILPADRPLLPGLPRLRTGSMTVPQSLRRKIMAGLTPNLVVSYGTNEVGSPLTLACGETLERYPDSVGFPVSGVELRITDDEGETLPQGEIGLVAAKTPGMPAAYHDNPAASARAFRGGWYYPGDLGMLSAEGALYLKGRADDLMNFDGIKIYPVEIEAVLLAHPAVAEAAAFPMPSARHQQVPVAAVVLRQDATAEALRRFCAERLGARAPKTVAILPALPRNAAGKVLTRELEQTMKGEPKRGG